MLAGFAFTGIIEAPWEYILSDSPLFVGVLIACFTILAMVFEIMAVVKSVQLSILGPKLALRGADGSMTRAVLVMRREERKMHWHFYGGLVFFYATIIAIVWAMLPWQIALAGTVLMTAGLLYTVIEFRDVNKSLYLPLLKTSYGASNLWSADEPVRRGGRARRAERRVERDAHRDAQRRERADAMATGAVSQGLSQGWALPLRTASAQRRPATLCCGGAPQQSVSMPSTPSTRDWASSLGRVLRQEASLQQLAPANGAQKDEGGLKAHSYTETASVCATPVASSQNGGTVLGDESLARELIKSTARPGGSALPPLRPTPPRLQNRRTVNLLIEKATEAGRSYCRSICLLIPRRCHTPDVIPQTSHPRRHIPDVIPPFDPDATTPFCPDVTPHVFFIPCITGCFFSSSQFPI